jgi:hypothetical protein
MFFMREVSLDVTVAGARSRRKIMLALPRSGVISLLGLAASGRPAAIPERVA